MTNYVILADDEQVGALDQFPRFAWVRGANLREGMILVDPELWTPVYVLDHKIGRARQGGAEWMVVDVENGGWPTTVFGTDRTFPVAVA